MIGRRALMSGLTKSLAAAALVPIAQKEPTVRHIEGETLELELEHEPFPYGEPLVRVLWHGAIYVQDGARVVPMQVDQGQIVGEFDPEIHQRHYIIHTQLLSEVKDVRTILRGQHWRVPESEYVEYWDVLRQHGLAS